MECVHSTTDVNIFQTGKFSVPDAKLVKVKEVP